ncbi:alpha/beta hydrolase [Dactylosporangium sp. NPDC005555]|uniref:alpha/beta fold hydrolase n=1 Tax=Dactylosporangium sp. NPDC005555 TaxID=3154889 RepID=UPI0033A674AE
MNHTTVTAGSLRVPGAALHYEVRGQGPLLVLVGAPMGTRFLAPLADLLAADHTVLTTDPRGIGASVPDDPDADSTPALRAADVAALVLHLDMGPAAVFGTSGGAVTALALAQEHPGRVHTVVAHEPPVTELLPDAAARRAAVEDIIATYAAGDVPGAWMRFLSNAAIPMDPDAPPPPAPDAQQMADERFWFLHEMRGTTLWRPDAGALTGGGARIVVGVGEASAGQICDRTSAALAALLGTEPVPFPGGHIAFVEDPVTFAPRLREVLAGPAQD